MIYVSLIVHNQKEKKNLNIIIFIPISYTIKTTIFSICFSIQFFYILPLWLVFTIN